MNIEQRFADFVCTLRSRDVPPDAQRIVRLVLLAATGAAVAGAAPVSYTHLTLPTTPYV